MNNLLQTIIDERKGDTVLANSRRPLVELKRQADSIGAHRSLSDRLRRKQPGESGPNIIAEVKKASPSSGVICRDYDPAAIAREYERAGACGISVLTEPRYFLGGNADLIAVSQAVKLPVLRKDFISTPYQVYESAVIGADVILLIVAALAPSLLRDLYLLARSVNLEAIVEVRSREELANALRLDEAIVGVNNRDLKTLKTDLSVARKLAANIPSDRMSIAESGIQTRGEIEEFTALGYRGFLVGTTLLKSADRGKCLRELLKV